MSKKHKAHNRWLPLQDGDFYYNHEGLLVFTAQYLLRRGYCCENACKHCPYGFTGKKKQSNNS